MQNERVSPNLKTFHELLSICARGASASPQGARPIGSPPAPAGAPGKQVSFPERAVHYLKEMRQHGFSPDMHTRGALIAACGEARALAELGLPPGAPSSSQAPQLLEAALEPTLGADNASRLFETMSAQELTVDIVTYNALMSAFERGGPESRRPDKALEVFLEIMQQGLTPNSDSYSIMLKSCMKDGQLDMALELFEAMQEQELSPGAEDYGAIIHLCVGAEQPEGALDVCVDMLDQAVAPSPGDCPAMLRACRLAGEPERALEMFNSILEVSIVPDVPIYNALMSNCAMLGTPEESAKVFKQIISRGLSPDTTSFNTLMEACKRHNETDRVHQLWSLMEDQAVVPDAGTYSSMVWSVSHAAHSAERALELMAAMRRSSLTPTSETYVASMIATENAGESLRTLELYQEMRRAHGAESRAVDLAASAHIRCVDWERWSLGPETSCMLWKEVFVEFPDELHKLESLPLEASLNILGCAETSAQAAGVAAREALDALRSMHAGRVAPDASAYGVVISACCKARQQDIAVRLLDNMQYHQVQPTAAIFGTLIEMCYEVALDGPTRAGLPALDAQVAPEVALELFQGMQELALHPGLSTCERLLVLCEEAVNPEAALDILECMPEHRLTPSRESFSAAVRAFALGLAPEVSVYNKMICRLYEGRQPQRALLIMDVMLEQRIMPNTITFNLLICACKGGKQPQTALEVFGAMKMQSLEPDVFTYNALISVAVKEDDTDGGDLPRSALLPYFSMMHEGLVPSVLTYHTLIDAYDKGGWPERALSLFEVMSEHYVTPNSTIYRAVISSCRALGRLDMALELLDTMHERSLGTADSYSEAICICASQHNFSKALELSEQLQWQVLVPDAATCSSLLAACGRSFGFEAWAMRLFEKMQENSVQPTSENYSDLVNAIAQGQDPTGALDVFEDMQALGVTTDADTYHVAIDTCRRLRQPGKAVELFERMQRQRLTPGSATFGSLAAARGGWWPRPAAQP